MNLTDEQKAVIALEPVSGKPIKITALAGTGKTSTLVEYANSRRTLMMTYIAYNKSVQLHAEKVVPWNVTPVTIHSLAFRAIGRKYKDEKGGSNKLSNLKAGSIMRYFNIRNYKFAYFITKTVESFVASNLNEIDKSCVPLGAEKIFNSEDVIDTIVEMAKKTWSVCIDKSDLGIPISHDGYLKLYQLSKPKIRTDVLLMDEAQDTTSCVWDIIMSQEAPKIIVGDPHQAIYQFRGARDAMIQVGSEPERDLSLTQSFRFGPAVAEVASTLLKNFKNEARKLRGSDNLDTHVYITDDVDACSDSIMLCRGNAVIFEEAFEASERGRIGFVGGSEGYRLDSYLDGLALYVGNKDGIVNPLFKTFDDFEDLEEFADATEDNELLGVVVAVHKYSYEIPKRVSTIRQKEVKFEKAQFAFSTIHKAKGLEWPSVIIGRDVERFIEAHLEDPKKCPYPDVEANLLYVALTRGSKEVVVSRRVMDFIQSGRKQLHLERKKNS